MARLEESIHSGDIVKYSIPEYSRDDITLAAGSGKLKCGTVLGKISASGKYEPVRLKVKNEEGADVDNTGGSQIACAVLLSDVDATTADAKAVALSRHSIVLNEYLIYPTDFTEDEKANALSELEAVGIIKRKGA